MVRKIFITFYIFCTKNDILESDDRQNNPHINWFGMAGIWINWIFNPLLIASMLDMQLDH